MFLCSVKKTIVFLAAHGWVEPNALGEQDAACTAEVPVEGGVAIVAIAWGAMGVPGVDDQIAGFSLHFDVADYAPNCQATQLGEIASAC